MIKIYVSLKPNKIYNFNFAIISLL